MELADLLAQLEVAKEQNRVLSERIRTLMSENEGLLRRMDELCRRVYGRKAEHVDSAQIAFAFAQLEAEAGGAMAPALGTTEPVAAPAKDAAAEDGAPAVRRGHGRKRLPLNLKRRRVEHEPAPSDCVCSGCSKPMKRIGEEVSEQLDFVPASFEVVEHVRGKYACPSCKEGVVIAPVPPKLIEKGLVAEGVVAQVVTAKFADHIPLARQETIYAREGVELSRSTLLDIANQAADLLAPVASAIKAAILASKVIGADETPVEVRSNPKGTRTGYFWPYLGEGPEVYFDFTPTRSGDGPMKWLAGFCGSLQADGYSGYDACVRAYKLTLLGCWAHARRYVFRAIDSEPDRATLLIALISKLYDVERAAKDLDEAGRWALRQKHSRPLIKMIEEKVAEFSASALPKSPLGKALTYLTNQWTPLTRFLEAGYLSIDNTRTERAIRPLAIGRNNWVTAGSEEGARRAAILYTIIGSCKLAGANPFEYVRDVLQRLSTTPVSRTSELTPRNWLAARQLAAANPAA
jgi:transposase